MDMVVIVHQLVKAKQRASALPTKSWCRQWTG